MLKIINNKKDRIIFYRGKKMKNLTGIAILLLLAACLQAGCGNQGKENGVHPTASPFNTSDRADASGTSTADPSKEQDDERSIMPTAAPEPIIQKSIARAGKEVYSDNVRTITVLGLKEYKSLKSKDYDEKTKKGLLDKAEKGSCYLVLFLEIANHAEKELHINPDYLKTKVDGNEVKNTFLLNDPEDYQTIFKTIGTGDYRQGFLVWEVPENWKKLSLTFWEFELLGGKKLKLTATPKNLKNPEPALIRAGND